MFIENGELRDMILAEDAEMQFMADQLRNASAKNERLRTSLAASDARGRGLGAQLAAERAAHEESKSNLRALQEPQAVSSTRRPRGRMQAAWHVVQPA